MSEGIVASERAGSPGTAPAGAAPPSPTVETRSGHAELKHAVARPTRLEPLAEDIFLTPRVVDKRTFDEFAALLRELVRSAAEQGRSLRGAADQAGGVKAGLETVAAELTSKLESALKVVPALDQRTARAEQLVRLAVDREALAERVSAQVGPQVKQLVEEALAKLREQAAGIVETTIGRLQQAAKQTEGRLNDAAESALARLEAAQAQARHAAAEIAEHTRERLAEQARASGVEAAAATGRWFEEARLSLEEQRRVAEAVRDEGVAAVEAARRQAEDALHRTADGLASRTQDTVRQAEVSLAGAASRHAESLESLARGTLDRAGEAQGRLAVRIEQAAKGVDDMLADLDAKLSPVHQWATQLVSEVERRLEEWRERGPAAAPADIDRASAASEAEGASVSALTAELAAARTACEQAGAELRSLIEQAGSLRGALADAVHRGAEHTESLDRELGRLEERRRALDSAVGESAARAERAMQALAEIGAETGQPLATLASARQHLEHMSGWLVQTAGQVHETGQAAAALLSRAQESSRTLSGLLVRLEPWRPLLLEGRADASLPPALEALVREAAERARAGGHPPGEGV
jgi:ABC-type transporter Mla subunit MlaD